MPKTLTVNDLFQKIGRLLIEKEALEFENAVLQSAIEAKIKEEKDASTEQPSDA